MPATTRRTPGHRRAAPLLAALLTVVASAGATDAPAAGATSAQSDVTGAAAVGVGTSHAGSHGKRLVRISAVGDTILGNTPDLPPDPAHYLDAVDRKLRWKAQIVFANLEGTLTTHTSGKCDGANGGECFAFRNPPHYAHYLSDAGLTILNDANNHSHDFGQAGLNQTVHAIHHHGMKQTGLPGEVTYARAGGVRVAFVAFAPYSDTADLLHLSDAAALIRKARHRAAVVVVYMHAGAEGADADHVTGHEEFYLGEDRGNPEKFAHMAIRSGAAAVIASGPHVVRGMQFYRHRLIAYSLGNFANFHDFGAGGRLSDSAILHLTLTSTGSFHAARLFAVRLDASGRPTLGGGTVDLVRSLSKQDFGRHRAQLSHDGKIHPPG